MESLIHRRSIRKYQDKEVDEQLLRRLLEQAEHTPTMGNLQLYSVVITRDPKMKERLAPAHFAQPMVTGWGEQRKGHPGYDNLLSFVNAATDALLYCQTFCNLAEEAGLGTCFLGTTIYQPLAIIDLLELPPLVFPIATITLGWPDEDPAQSDRLPLDGIVHEEVYHDYTPQQIDDIYGPKENLPENKQYVEINHTETLAQVFTDIRYTAKDCEAMSEELKKALHHQGFM